MSLSKGTCFILQIVILLSMHPKFSFKHFCFHYYTSVPSLQPGRFYMVSQINVRFIIIIIKVIHTVAASLQDSKSVVNTKTSSYRFKGLIQFNNLILNQCQQCMN